MENIEVKPPCGNKTLCDCCKARNYYRQNGKNIPQIRRAENAFHALYAEIKDGDDSCQFREFRIHCLRLDFLSEAALAIVLPEVES